MTITIPVWLLWALGVVIGVPLLVFLAVGCIAAGFIFADVWRRRNEWP